MISLDNLTLQNWNPFSIYPEIIEKRIMNGRKECVL